MADMTGIEVKMHLQKIALIAQVAMPVPTEELLKIFSYNDTMGPFLDPTGWRDTHENAEKNQRAVRALAAFQKEIREAWPEFEAMAEAAVQSRA